MKLKTIILTAVTSAVLFSCATVPLTGRKQFNTVSDAEAF
jgi:hypothetical protein